MEQPVAKKTIKIEVGLNESNHPVTIDWTADDQQASAEMQASKAILLSLFDRHSLETLKIDLWTKDMQVMEMDRFFFQTLRSLADTYYRATQNGSLAADFQSFVQYFGEKTEIIPKK